MNNRPYHYAECGLPNIYLVNGFALRDSPYGKTVTISNLPGLHKCIADTLCEKPGLLTGNEFRFLRIELDFSQTILAQIFGCDARTIRRIESGAVREWHNMLIRHIYLESIDPKSTCVGLFEHLRNIDVEWHDRIKLEAKDDNWSCSVA